MKNLWKILVVLILCIAALTACGGNNNDDTTTTTQTPSGNDDQTPPVDTTTPVTLVDANRKSNYTIYYYEGVADSSKELLDKFASSLRDKTRVSKIPVYKVTATAANDFEITFNVTTERSDAAASYARTPLTDYELTRNGNRIIITAHSDKALETVLNHLLASLQQDSAKNWIIPGAALSKQGRWVADSEILNKTEFNAYLSEVNALPKFDSATGYIQPVYPLANDGYQFAYTNAAKADYDAYLAKLEAAGYTKYDQNVMSAGSQSNETNVYTTYTKDNIHVFAAWQGNLKVARVAFMPAGELPALTPVTTAASVKTVKPTVAQMQLYEGGEKKGGGGMSYVIQLSDGKFIIIDSGTSATLSQQALVNHLETKAAEAGMEKPVIAMWFFSHSHDDHIGLARRIMLKYASEHGYVIESFAYNFPVQDHIDFETYPGEDTSGYILSFEFAVENYFPEAKVYTPHAGQVYHFVGMDMEILATEEDVYPLETIVTHNGACITWRMNFVEGPSVMFLGDNHTHINKQIAKVYGDYLKSDVLQMAHHGLSGGEITMYQAVDPDICLWPTTETRFSGNYDDNLNDGYGPREQGDQWCLGYVYRVKLDNKGNPVLDADGNPVITVTVCSEANVWIRDESIKERDHYHNSQTTILDITDLTKAPEIHKMEA